MSETDVRMFVGQGELFSFCQKSCVPQEPESIVQRRMVVFVGSRELVVGYVIAYNAIIQGAYVVRGNPDKPVLMVEGRERGFGFLANVAINPHLSASKRENELVSVIDRYPHLLGLGIDDDTGLLVRGSVAEVIGTGRVAGYDNQKHPSGWYYWLKAGDKLDLTKR